MMAHEHVLRDLGCFQRPVSTLTDRHNTIPFGRTDRVTQRMWQILLGGNARSVDNTVYHVSHHGLRTIYRRSPILQPAWTVMAHGGGGTHGDHYQRERGQLTLRERARIQTVPDTCQFSGIDPDGRPQIGEAVPPRMAKVIADLLHAMGCDLVSEQK